MGFIGFSGKIGSRKTSNPKNQKEERHMTKTQERKSQLVKMIFYLYFSSIIDVLLHDLPKSEAPEDLCDLDFDILPWSSSPYEYKMPVKIGESFTGFRRIFYSGEIYLPRFQGYVFGGLGVFCHFPFS
jgi:hypothetical protein